jgi:hypothetical protein
MSKTVKRKPKRNFKGGMDPVMPLPNFKFTTDKKRQNWINLVLPYASDILHILQEIDWRKFTTMLSISKPFANMPGPDDEGKMESANEYCEMMEREGYTKFNVQLHTKIGQDDTLSSERAYRYEDIPEGPIEVYDQASFHEFAKRPNFSIGMKYLVEGDGEYRSINQITFHPVNFFPTPFLLVGGCGLELYASVLDKLLAPLGGIGIRNFVDLTADIDVHVFIQKDYKDETFYEDSDVLSGVREFIQSEVNPKIVPKLRQIGEVNVNDTNPEHYQYDVTPAVEQNDDRQPDKDHILEFIFNVVEEMPDFVVLRASETSQRYPLRNLWYEAQRAYLRTVEERDTIAPSKLDVSRRRFQYIIHVLWKIYGEASHDPLCRTIQNSIRPSTIEQFFEKTKFESIPANFFPTPTFLSDVNNMTILADIKKLFLAKRRGGSRKNRRTHRLR